MYNLLLGDYYVHASLDMRTFISVQVLPKGGSWKERVSFWVARAPLAVGGEVGERETDGGLEMG